MRTVSEGAIEAKYLIRTHTLFRVMAFHPETQTVDIREDMFELVADALGTIYKNNEFGLDVPYSLRAPDVLYGIPVKQLRWGQFSIECCPVEGDTGYVEYFQDDISSWMKDGKRSQPSSAIKFLRGSCVFVPFIPNKENCKEDYPEDNTKLIIRGASAKIELVDDGENTSVNITANELNVSADKMTMSGDVEIEGKVTAKGDIESTEGKVTAKSDIKSTDGDVLAGAISLKNHKHAIPVNQVLVGAQGGIPNATPIDTTRSEG